MEDGVDEARTGPLVDGVGRRVHPGVPIVVIALVVGAIVLGFVAGGDERGVSTARPVASSVGPSVSHHPNEEITPTDLFGPGEVTRTVDRTAGETTTSTVRSGTPMATDVAPTAPATTAVVTPPPVAPPLPTRPAVQARPIPVEPPPPPPDAPQAPWASSVVTTAGGHVSTDVGCASDLSAAGLDAFFASRVGPVVGWDYQHVYPLGGDRYLWLFQDTFVDHSNTAASLDAAGFVHNTALVQEGTCFRLLHRGSTSRPAPFEQGTGTATLSTWFWPMGGEVHDGRLYVFWARMVKDAVDPPVPDGLGWHPDITYVATYDTTTLARLDFRQATQPGTAPIYGYTVQSDGDWTYLFGNSFEQNLSREGGWANGPHSATRVYLARVPRGALFDQPTYWTSTGWNMDRRVAEPVLERNWAEFPFQPRVIDGRWVASSAVDGYWGDAFELDVANDPWGPWTTVESGPMEPRGGDPKMNTYHAHLMPWRDRDGNLVTSVSNNARDMLRDAWPVPARYRPMVFTTAWREPPAPTTAPPTTTTTLPASTTTTTTATTTPTSTSTTTTTSTTTSSTSTTAPVAASTDATTTTADRDPAAADEAP